MLTRRNSIDKKSVSPETQVIEGELRDYSEPAGFWEKFIHAIEVQPRNGMTMKQMFLFNQDLKPVEAKRRTWRWWNFVFFWIADALNINSLQIAATGVAAGMTWWQTWISVWLGYSIVAIFVVLTARMGAYYHVSFPVACRASFGPFGSLWPVINRVVMAIIWFSVQTWILGQCVQLMLMSIFGTDLDTRLGTQNLSGTTTFQFMSFFLAWLFQLPFLWFPPHQIRHLFTVKAVVVPAAGIAYLIWVLTKSKGLGSVMHERATLHGSELGWAFVSSTMNCVANFAALILNAPDFSRFAHSKDSSLWSQLITIPTAFAVTTLIGILTAAASGNLFGEVYWSPLDILHKLLDEYTSGDRAGVFFIALCFCLAQVGTNIAANSLSCGTDLTALLPRFMNIRRGSYVCAALALCLVPWNFFKSANNFTTYLSAYSVFLSSIAGVICCDYFWIRRGYLDVQDLYSDSRDSRYMFMKLGLNWRAYAAYLLGLVPNMPGFVGAVGRDVPSGAIYLYKLNYFVGFLVSFFLYASFVWISPVKGVPPQVAPNKLFTRGWFEEYAYVEDFDEMYFKQRATLIPTRSNSVSYRSVSEDA